jgi:uncharacterized damage-inducible protein DinB
MLARIEERRRELLAQAETLTAEQLTFRPGPGHWSSLDVLEHLVKVEEGIAPRIRVRERRSLVETARTRGALLLMFAAFGLRRRIKVPVQAIVPLGGVTLADLAKRWEEAQVAMKTALERFGPGDWSRPMMRHPLIGLLTPAESLTFILWHMGHHHKQIERIRQAPGFPR